MSADEDFDSSFSIFVCYKECGLRNSNFITGARIAVLIYTETTQKIYRGGAEVDFFSRSRYYNTNYGYPSTSDEGYFFSGTVDNYEFCHLEFTLSESFTEFRDIFEIGRAFTMCNSVVSYCTSTSNMHHVQSNEDC